MPVTCEGSGDGIGAHVPTGNAYDKYGTKNPIERRLMDGFFSSLDRSLPRTAPGSVLEIGVGEGEVSRRLGARWPGARMVALDLPDEGLAARWVGAGFTPLFSDASHLPFPDRTFDLVLAIEVLEHVDDPTRALGEIARVARADVILSVPREPIWRAANMARGKYMAQLGNTPGHVNHWTKRGFVQLVRRQLAIHRIASPFPWTMVAARVSTAG